MKINTNVIDFDFGYIVFFFSGIVFGLIIGVIIYLFMFLKSIKPQQYIIKAKTEGLTENQIDEKIEFAQNVFLDKKIQGDLSSLAHCKNVCQSLILDIASAYFPDSKRPLFELSVDEVLMLGIYISNRLNEILDQKGVRLLKKIKVSSIIGMGDVKKTIDESTLMKATKKYKLKGAFEAVKGALNVVNPVYWAKKLIINQTVNFATSKICLMLIGITAEETYKIYSKSVFNKDVVIEEKYHDLAASLKNDLANITEEEIMNFDVNNE